MVEQGPTKEGSDAAVHGEGQNEKKVAYCPTENMLADFFTKPLQGAVFRRREARS